MYNHKRIVIFTRYILILILRFKNNRPYLINYILSTNESNKYNLDSKVINEKNYSYNLVCKNIHPNFISLTSELKKQDIKVEDIRNLLKFLHKSAYSSNIKCILID